MSRRSSYTQRGRINLRKQVHTRGKIITDITSQHQQKLSNNVSLNLQRGNIVTGRMNNTLQISAIARHLSVIHSSFNSANIRASMPGVVSVFGQVTNLLGQEAFRHYTRRPRATPSLTINPRSRLSNHIHVAHAARPPPDAINVPFVQDDKSQCLSPLVTVLQHMTQDTLIIPQCHDFIWQPVQRRRLGAPPRYVTYSPEKHFLAALDAKKRRTISEAPNTQNGHFYNEQVEDWKLHSKPRPVDVGPH